MYNYMCTDRAKDRPYVPEIDGLRALAVLSVLLFHAFPQLCPGGYIGVDIFFVISGYVICRKYLTSLIEGKESLQHFYIKRIRRLAPAYTTVLSISLLFAFFLLTPKLLHNYSNSLMAQCFYGQNFVFWIEGDYFDKALTKPLLHTWSLAVEEQFYLLFGLMIIFLRWKQRFLIALFVIILITSLWLGYAVSGASPKTSFYLLPTRIWEFTVGFFAYLLTKKLPLRTEIPGINFIYPVCISALIVSIFCFNETSTFPGIQAITACASVFLLLIMFEIHPTILGFSIFKYKPILYIGKISYSLYLWHWPIIVYLFLSLGRRLFWYEAIGALALSITLSSLTYHGIENPIRKKKYISSARQLLFCLTTSSTVFFIIGLLLIFTKGALFRYKEPERTLLEAAQEKSPYRCGKLFRITNPTKEICKTNKIKGGNGVLIIGDSHADQLDEMLSELGKEMSIPVFLTVRNCQFDQFQTINNCKSDIFHKILDEIEELDIRTIIAVSFWHSSELTYTSFRDNMDFFLKEDMTVYFSEVVPYGPFFNPTKRAFAAHNDTTLLTKSSYTIKDYLDDVTLQRSIFYNLKMKFPEKVFIVSPSNYLCNSTDCDFYTDGYPNYFDDHHLTKVGVNRLKPMYMRIFKTLSTGANSQTSQR